MTRLSETTHTARKPHRCEACQTVINPGERYARWSGLTDGDFASIAFHVDCRNWEIELNHRADLRYDEWTALHELVANEPGDLDGAPEEVRKRFGSGEAANAE